MFVDFVLDLDFTGSVHFSRCSMYLVGSKQLDIRAQRDVNSACEHVELYCIMLAFNQSVCDVSTDDLLCKLHFCDVSLWS